ncbi:unnamed protein product [Rotaria sordida]|uniref:Uncharacterized protein n=1 Tax=Rotaria sordida TaxID=392033 RepID=A0A818KY30_9BILA|nr:unnamed protein product [Rotaria sordida]CAF3557981.1 unnamed protein product [Rotaria sordida]
MAATTVKTDPIRNDKMKFHTQIVDGKPQIFFDANDESSKKTKSKRNSRATNTASRLTEQQKTKINNQKSPIQNGTNKSRAKTEQPTNKIQVNDDGSTLGIYMTMDELTELVKAVKENSKNDNKTNTANKQEPPAPPPPPPPPQQQQQYIETTAPPMVPKLDLPSEHPPPPPVHGSPREQVLSIMAEKKRQKWLREKAEIERLQLEIEYDQLKHQLSPRLKKNSVSPERSTFQYDFPPTTTNKPTPVPSVPQSFKPNDYQHDVSPKVTEIDPNHEAFKTQLLEKKQQQWRQENSEKVAIWNPFGRPGGGAPNINENQSRTSQLPSNTVVSHRPPIPPHTNNSSSSLSPTLTHSDQTHVPAAMRTNLLFGDVRFEDDVKTAKEIERRQWLEDLQKQVEENKHKKYFQQETDRRQDFLHENIRPLVQEAAHRHQQQTNHNGQDLNRFNQHDSLVQQNFETNESTKYDKRAQLVEKLKRNGYPIDSLTKTTSDMRSTGTVSNQKTGEKIFGPNYDSPSGQNMNNKIEPLHLNVAIDRHQVYRPTYARRDEAVNTVDSTFRSDHGVQTDLRLVVPNRPTNSHAYEESDLPPQVPNHHYRNAGYRNISNQPGKKNSRMHSLDDNHSSRRTSSINQTNSNDDDTMSQISNQRSSQGPIDIHHRPLWNYNNPKHREYVPNSKRDPHYEERQRLKHFQQGNFDRIDDVQKKICYNRWNSDSELQQQQKKSIPTNRIRSTISKTSTNGNHKDESIMNLLKLQNKYQQDTFGTRKPSSMQTKNDEDFNSNRGSSLDKYESYIPHTRNDEIIDRTKINSPLSQSRETSPHKELMENNTNDNYRQQREWDNTNKQYPNVEPPQYNPPQYNPPQYNQPQYNQPQSREEHILQQLSAIKENLVRRQRELAT